MASRIEKIGNKITNCWYCGKALGETDADCQSFKFYGSPVTVWDKIRFTCECKKPYLFSPLDPSGDDQCQKNISYEILNKLGKD